MTTYELCRILEEYHDNVEVRIESKSDEPIEIKTIRLKTNHNNTYLVLSEYE